MYRLSKLLLVSLAIASLLACSRVQPIREIHQPVPLANYHGDFHQILLQALAHGKWVVEEDRPQQILARIDFRGHSASITLNYSATRYDILYRDSEKLRYADGKIHKRYNALVKRLHGLTQHYMKLSVTPEPSSS
jgi:hypothetical protein